MTRLCRFRFMAIAVMKSVRSAWGPAVLVILARRAIRCDLAGFEHADLAAGIGPGRALSCARRSADQREPVIAGLSPAGGRQDPAQVI